MTRVRGCLAAGLLAAAIFAAATAFAQDAVVDGERITADDIDQRSRLDQLATHKAPSRQQVIAELSTDARAVREARRHGIELADAAVDWGYAKMAIRMHLTADQLTQAFAHQGVDARTVKQRIRADLARVLLLRAHGPLWLLRDGLRWWNPGPSPAGPRLSDADSTPEERKCLQEFTAFRTEVETRAKAAATESKKRPTRDRMCELVSDYAAAELELVKFAETNMAKCGIPLQLVEQIKTVHVRTLDTKKRMCAPAPPAPKDLGPSPQDLGPPPNGPRWCANCLRLSDLGGLAARSMAEQ